LVKTVFWIVRLSPFPRAKAGAAVAVDFVFLLRSVNDGVSVDINVLRQNNVVSEFYGNGAARLVVANDFQQFVAA
jgi:hypothetical protein